MAVFRYSRRQPRGTTTRWGRGLGRRLTASVVSIGLVVGVTAVGAPTGSLPSAAAAQAPANMSTNTTNDGETRGQWDPLGRKKPGKIQVKSPENNKPLAPDNSASGRCKRDPLASNFQRCEIYSPAMRRNIPIHYKPAARGGHSALLLLDGASARDDVNRWITRGLAPYTMNNTDIAVIAPIGGGASWYVDWQYRNCSLTHPNANPQMWETFITKELRAWGTRQGIHPSLYSVAGFSMGGGSALILAGRHHDMFKQALSYSGATTLVIPGVQPVLNLTEDLGPCILGPFGGILNPTRYQLDPTLNVEKLRGIDVYASAANGIPRKNATPQQFWHDAKAGMWETGALILLKFFDDAAQRKNVPVTVNYLGRGSHQYEDAARELRATRNRILTVMKREERKLGAAADPLKYPPTKKLSKDESPKGEPSTPSEDEILVDDGSDAYKKYDELRNDDVFRDGIGELEEEYGQDVVLCLIDNDELAWTRSIPAHPVVSDTAIQECQRSAAN